MPSPFIAFVISDVAPVNIGLADGAFRSWTVCNPAASLIYIPVILLPSAAGPFNQARPFMVVVPLRTALTDATLLPNSSTLYSTELTLDASKQKHGIKTLR